MIKFTQSADENASLKAIKNNKKLRSVKVKSLAIENQNKFIRKLSLLQLQGDTDDLRVNKTQPFIQNSNSLAIQHI